MCPLYISTFDIVISYSTVRQPRNYQYFYLNTVSMRIIFKFNHLKMYMIFVIQILSGIHILDHFIVQFLFD